MSGIVEALLAESLAAEDAEERGAIVLVLHPLGQLDHVIPAAGLGVKLGDERDGGVGVRLELLDDVDGTGEVFVLLFQLGEGQTDRVAVDWQLGRYALNALSLQGIRTLKRSP